MRSAVSCCLACVVFTFATMCAVSQTDEKPGSLPPTSCTPPALYCVGGMTSTTPIRQNNVFVSSLNISSSDETILTNMLGPGNPNNSHITGVLVSVPSGCLSGCVTGGPYIDYGGATHGSGVYCPSPDFTALDSFVSTVYGANTTNRKLTNIVVAPAGYNNNTETPSGIFSQAWANTLADCSGNALYSLTWGLGHLYMPGDYIRDSGGNFWQIRTGTANVNFKPTNATFTSGTAKITVTPTPASSLIGQSITVTLATPSGASQYNVVDVPVTNVSGSAIWYSLGPTPTFSGSVTAGDITGDARCTAGSNGSPTPSTTSPYTDGSGTTACTWYKIGTNAPPQDAWVASQYTGSAAYEISLGTTGSSCTLSSLTCKVSLTTPYVGSVGDSITVQGVSTSGATEMNCIGCSVTAITSTQVTYSDSNVTSGFAGLINSGATLTAQRVFNTNSVNGSSNLSVIASGLPTAYEAPMKAWIKYICRQVYSHYASDSRVGYIRCGLTEGGEADTVGLKLNPGWPFGSQAVFVSYYMDFMSYVSGLASTDGLICMGNLNSFDLPEGQISISDSCGIGTNGYKVDDVVAINFNSDCLVITDVQSDWCWNFNQYQTVTMPNGKQPILELQTSKTSTPGSDVLGTTGGLSHDSTTCGSYCPWPGLTPLADTYKANDGEWYMCDFEIAYDPNYSTDGCNSSYASYKMPYQTAFGGFAP